MSDRLALVTGTSSGIGVAVARRLLDRGWAVIGMARRHAAFRGGTGTYRHLTVDLADVAASCASIERDARPILTGERWSRIGLVNNAASGGLLGPAERISPVIECRVPLGWTVSPVRGARHARVAGRAGRGHRRVPGGGRRTAFQ